MDNFPRNPTELQKATNSNLALCLQSSDKKKSCNFSILLKSDVLLGPSRMEGDNKVISGVTPFVVMS